jgi:hypothetical protein
LEAKKSRKVLRMSATVARLAIGAGVVMVNPVFLELGRSAAKHPLATTLYFRSV